MFTSCVHALLFTAASDSPISTMDQVILTSFLIMGILAFIALLFMNAPYGKLQNEYLNWIPKMNGVLGWVIQEATSNIVFLITYLRYFSDAPIFSFPFACLFLWQFHYIHRSFIYPLIRVASISETNVLVVLLAVFFNITNAYLNAKFILYTSQLSLIRRVLGLLIFFIGMAINWHSDEILIRLRKNPKKDDEVDPIYKRYRIPRGGFFEYVTCANYFGEIVEWFGFALFVGHCASWVFVINTMCNLVPRAIAAHKWYIQTFGDAYPKNRKSVFPFIL